MATLGEEKYIFETDWYDNQAEIVRKYLVTYFPVTRCLEIYDVKNQRQFLKKQEVPSVHLEDFYIGANVTIFARVHKVTDYGDVYTRRRFMKDGERTFAMIKPDAYRDMGRIIDATQAAGFTINKLKMSRFSQMTAQQFYKEHAGKPFFNNLVSFMSSDVSIGMELANKDAVLAWRSLIGPTNSTVAKSEAPQSIRGCWGTDGTKNAAHGSDSAGSYKRENDFWFGQDPASRPMQTTAVFNNCTLCLIKPHVLREGNFGKVISMILDNGFEISAMELFNLTRPVIEEFYDVYKGVLPEYLPLIEHFTGGPTIALEVRQNNAVAAFRDLCGPHDPEIAKHLRPNTIRAQFGQDRVRNAVHCTDMPEDGVLECKYFFNILQQHQF